MQDYLHFEQLCALLRLLRPLARTLGPWPFVVLVLIAFEMAGLAHHLITALIAFVKAALAAFFIASFKVFFDMLARLEEMLC